MVDVYLRVSLGVGALHPAEGVKGTRVDSVHVVDAVDRVAYILKNVAFSSDCCIHTEKVCFFSNHNACT